METESLELDVEDLPPGYVLIRKEDGMFAFLKMEPEFPEEEDDENEQQHEITEEVIEEGDADMEVTEEVGEDEIVQEEIDINVIPDIIEEDLPPGLSPGSIEQTVTNDQVEFNDRTVKSASNVAKQHTERKFKVHTQTTSQWKGVTIPPHLTQEEVERFKSQHLLQRLSERVIRNNQKVVIYEKKNDSLRNLIANQRDQMTKMGFHVRDIVRHHNIRKKKDPGPRIPSPLVALEVMNESERMDYEKTRMEAEYAHLRKRLKTLLSGYRRYKKVFVENHEKIKKGPKQRENTMLYKKREAMLMQQASQESDSDLDTGRFKPFRCYHCRYGADTKAELRSHIEGHLTQKQYKCCVCPFFTSRITPFLEHMKAHPGAKAFCCKHCDFRTAHPSAMRNHEATHLSVKPFKCLVCGFRTVRSDHLRNHMRRHKNERTFKCALCSFTSKYPSGLSKHKNTVHAPNYVAKRKPYSNSRTKEEFTNSESEDAGETTEIEIDEKGKMLFVRHLGSSSKKQFSNEQGERRRSQRQNVKKVMDDYIEGDEFDEGDIVQGEEADENHVIVKEEEITEDEEYGEIVYEEEENESDAERGDEEQGKALVSEEESTHEFAEEMGGLDEVEGKPHEGKDLLSSYVIYQCVFCEFSCEMKHNLITHLRSHMEYWSFTCRACNFTASNPLELQTHTEAHKNEGENCCPFCDHVTNSKDRLRNHVEKRHPPGKPLSCVYCDYISSSRSSMKAHMHGHKSKKVWQCLICSYKAEFRSGLKRHLRKHTGERPYHCPHCEFNAAQYSHLTRHLRNNHPDEPVLETRPASPFVIL